jgi:sugar phosphate isomerase/epimerase
MPTRREFLQTSLLLAAAPLAAAPAGDRSGMCLAYTSFAVRMLQGRDIMKTTAAALPAELLFDLCARFGSGGAQLDWSQMASRDPDALAALRTRIDRDRLVVELSAPSSCLTSPDAFAELVRVAGALGVSRVRIALLYGRRYESFKTRADWDAWAAGWRKTLLEMKPTLNRAPILIGLENHKDFHASELVALLDAIDSPSLGVCVDFGNNLALLEEPLETVRLLAPRVVTTHLKDMAVKRTPDGFALSEVPLGEGMLPLVEIIALLRAARPDVHFCLEMLTRDPLPVPYKDDRYWIALDRPPAERLAAFERDVLAREASGALPHITGLPPDRQIALEDEQVRRSMAYARGTLGL